MSPIINGAGLAPLALMALSGLGAWATGHFRSDDPIDRWFEEVMSAVLFVGTIMFGLIFVWAALNWSIWPNESPYP